MGRRRGEEGSATCLMTGVRMLLFHNLHHGLGVGRKKKRKKPPTVKASSCCVVSLGLSQKPPYVMPTSLLLLHTKVSGKLGANLVNPQNADTCPNTVSVGTECCPASRNVLVSAIVSTSQGHPRRNHNLQNNTSDLGSWFPLSMGQKGVPGPVCAFDNLRLHHFTLSKIGTMRDFPV